MTPNAFRTARVIDPACGSGIFLRSFLEQQCNPTSLGVTLQTIRDCFHRAEGIEINPDAANAAKLSLSLLHLALADRPADRVKVSVADAIQLAIQDELLAGHYDIVVANPPYVKIDHLPADRKSIYIKYIGRKEAGRIDSYVAFVKLCLSLVGPGGFVCLVLPHSFLINRNSRWLREQIASGFDVRCLVDISEKQVFEGLGIYNVLLILQRRHPSITERPSARIVRCQDAIGVALEVCLQGRNQKSDLFEVFEIDQSVFEDDAWMILNAQDVVIRKRMGALSRLADFFDVRQGFVTGADDVFIRDQRSIPATEKEIYIPYLPDREIGRYKIPLQLSRVVFYPYWKGEMVDEKILKTHFPKTWEYLKGHEKALRSRKSVLQEETPWWRPVRPRTPDSILRPKIVMPHLMLTPRFAIDFSGRVGVSHSPYLIPRSQDNADVLLKFFCAMLNSPAAHWYISRHLHRYSRGYIMLEVRTLRSLPVPDPAKISSQELVGLVNRIDAHLSRPSSDLERQIETLALDLYGLKSELQQFVSGSRLE